MTPATPCPACATLAIAITDPELSWLQLRILAYLNGANRHPTARELAAALGVPFSPHIRGHVADLAMRGLIVRDNSYPARIGPASLGPLPPAQDRPAVRTVKAPTRKPKAPAVPKQTDEQKAFYGFYDKFSKLHTEIRPGAILPPHKSLKDTVRQLWVANERDDDAVLGAYRAYLEEWVENGSDATYGKGSPVDFAKNCDKYKDAQGGGYFRDGYEFDNVGGWLQDMGRMMSPEERQASADKYEAAIARGERGT